MVDEIVKRIVEYFTISEKPLATLDLFKRQLLYSLPRSMDIGKMIGTIYLKSIEQPNGMLICKYKKNNIIEIKIEKLKMNSLSRINFLLTNR